LPVEHDAGGACDSASRPGETTHATPGDDRQIAPRQEALQQDKGRLLPHAATCLVPFGHDQVEPESDSHPRLGLTRYDQADSTGHPSTTRECLGKVIRVLVLQENGVGPSEDTERRMLHFAQPAVDDDTVSSLAQSHQSFYLIGNNGAVPTIRQVQEAHRSGARRGDRKSRIASAPKRNDEEVELVE
jgi:hypothetical protein